MQWTLSNQATLGTNQSVLIRGVASFQGGTCPAEYKGGHISGVQIRGSSLYYHSPCCFSVDAPSSEKKWYDSDDDTTGKNSTAIATTSVISPTYSSGQASKTTPHQPVEPVSSKASRTPEHRSSRDESAHRKVSKTQSGPLHGSTRQSGKTGFSDAAVANGRGDSKVDGTAMSRHRSDGKVKGNSPKPPAIPPKTRRRERSKSAGTISKNLRSTTSHRTSQPSQSGSSRRIISVVSSSKGKDEGAAKEGVPRLASQTSLESYSSHSASHASASRSSLTSQGSSSAGGSGRGGAPGGARVARGPVNHDYATLEPPEHDYAILDPEYHEEFYGKWRSS